MSTNPMPGLRDFHPGDEPAEVADQLRRKGVAIVRRLVPEAELTPLRSALEELLESSPLGEHRYVGLRTRRTQRLFARTRAADALATDPFVLAVLEDLLGEIQLTAPAAIELLPGEEAGHWHHDDHFYRFARPHPDLVCNVITAIDAFTAVNGATEVVVGSNQWRQAREPGATDRILRAEMAPGDAVLFTGRTVHRWGSNDSDSSRIGLALEYAAAWLRPQETMTLSVPPAIAATTPERLQALLGYAMTSSGLGHVGGRTPDVVLTDAGR